MNWKYYTQDFWTIHRRWKLTGFYSNVFDFFHCLLKMMFSKQIQNLSIHTSLFARLINQYFPCKICTVFWSIRIKIFMLYICIYSFFCSLMVVGGWGLLGFGWDLGSFYKPGRINLGKQLCCTYTPLICIFLTRIHWLVSQDFCSFAHAQSN